LMLLVEMVLSSSFALQSSPVLSYSTSAPFITYTGRCSGVSTQKEINNSQVVVNNSQVVVNNCKLRQFVRFAPTFGASPLFGSLFLSVYFTSPGRFIPTCREAGCSFPGCVLTTISLYNAAVAGSYPSFAACLHSPVFNRT
jgi:hypothetical protein